MTVTLLMLAVIAAVSHMAFARIPLFDLSGQPMP